MKQKPKAFIFDLDGVITDTAEFHFLAWGKLAKGLGITIDRKFNEKLKGISRRESLELILALKPSLQFSHREKEQLAANKNEHYKEFINTITPDHILPGINALLETIKDCDIKIALGSASKNGPAVLGRLGLIDFFDYIVDAGTVTKGKPDPETFVTAADYLQLPYEECIGVEDASAGVEAIKSANMFAVGVGSKKHLTNADYVVEDTSELKFEKILERYHQNGGSNKRWLKNK
jgi:beta-phosphoglucomutase